MRRYCPSPALQAAAKEAAAGISNMTPAEAEQARADLNRRLVTASQVSQSLEDITRIPPEVRYEVFCPVRRV